MKMNMRRGGFSLVEVIVALTILTVGILAMGASTGYILAQIRASELRTERMGAMRQAAETLRAAPWSNLNSTCSSWPLVVERYRITCQVTRPNSNLARVRLVTSGPGYSGGRFVTELADTFAISLVQPLP